MLQKLGQKYQQKLFRTEQLSPPLKRFRVYPQTLDEVDQENEIFLDFKTAKEEQYGGWFSTGMFGVVIAVLLCFAELIVHYDAGLIENLKVISGILGFAIIVMGLPGTIEILKPLPAPWRFNRRTREVYALDSTGQLYHAPWDNIAAYLSAGTVFIPKSGPMSTAVLEVQLHRFGHPDQTLNIALGMVLGGQRYQKLRLWEYLCTYMEQGPGFETLDMASAAGKHIVEPDSELYNPDAPVLSQEERQRAHEEFNRSPIVRLFALRERYSLIMNLQRWAYRRALRRPRKHPWPEVVLERCRPDGPTTRLVDIEPVPVVQTPAACPEASSPAPQPEPPVPTPAPESTEARIAAHRERIRAARAAKI